MKPLLDVLTVLSEVLLELDNHEGTDPFGIEVEDETSRYTAVCGLVSDAGDNHTTHFGLYDLGVVSDDEEEPEDGLVLYIEYAATLGTLVVTLRTPATGAEVTAETAMEVSYLAVPPWMRQQAHKMVIALIRAVDKRLRQIEEAEDVLEEEIDYDVDLEEDE